MWSVIGLLYMVIARIVNDWATSVGAAQMSRSCADECAYLQGVDEAIEITQNQNVAVGVPLTVYVYQ